MPPSRTSVASAVSIPTSVAGRSIPPKRSRAVATPASSSAARAGACSRLAATAVARSPSALPSRFSFIVRSFLVARTGVPAGKARKPADGCDRGRPARAVLAALLAPRRRRAEVGAHPGRRGRRKVLLRRVAGVDPLSPGLAQPNVLPDLLLALAAGLVGAFEHPSGHVSPA